MNQQIIQGIDKLPQILKEINSKKLFLVVGRKSYKSLPYYYLVESLDAEKIYFTDYTPNPQYEEVCKGIELFKKEKCDCILAIGGGSPIDVAKCIKVAVLAQEGNNAIIPPLVSKQVELDGSMIPFIAVPTTAGTGSESTHNAVMYYDGAKQTVTNDGVLPDYAILEPSALKDLSLYQKKCTMMDALCQGIESWWSVNSTDESKEYSKMCVELIMANWEKYIFENDSAAAEQIMLGANYSGRAINIAQTTAAHAMSYKITSLYGLPHGHAVAVCLSEVWSYMIGHLEQCQDKRGFEYLANIFNDIAVAMGENTPAKSNEIFRTVMRKINLLRPTANKREEELEILSKSVNSIRLKNNPIALEDLKKIYTHIIL